MERKFEKYMFIRKNGKATHSLGDVTRNVFDAELIFVYNETKTEWIGRYCEGFMFFDVRFLKSDCRNATVKEIELCKKGRMEEIKF